jgi:hypothetical protein
MLFVFGLTLAAIVLLVIFYLLVMQSIHQLPFGGR